ncbi:uncharacterized protein LOC132749976 [Ruditapes philippinarum]|uniref:uncharacterized protein LOC132749976 n=1 Tax=Ruditapes philippinarum TaxID=129788 RepID=UPI00295A61EC|nr:uncharacterized protein LOC132749976 [Ruditapes philippinarum]
MWHITLDHYLYLSIETLYVSSLFQGIKMTFDFAVLLLFASCAFAAGSSVPSPLKCFECTDINDPSLCNTVTTCTPDEMCYVNEMANTNNRITYSMGCARKHPCIESTGFLIQNSNLFHAGSVVGKRRSGLVACSACCGDSLCNNMQCFALIKNLTELWKGGHLDLASLSYKQ